MELLERRERAERFPEALERFGASFSALSDEELGEWFAPVEAAAEAHRPPWEYPNPMPGYERWKQLGGEPLVQELEELFSGLHPEEQDAVFGPARFHNFYHGVLAISEERRCTAARVSLRLRREREREAED